MFTDKQLSDFKAYEQVRSSGKYNMLTAQARYSTGLERDEYNFVITNFAELKQANNQPTTGV
tara:strand:- start:360 stop:545 length:186 start_codon:yes stop_codon:yes gene_type:complete